MPSSNLASGNCEIATRAELLQRLNERAKPEAQLNLTPERGDALTINSQVETAKEARIGQLQERLDRAGREVERDHAFARLEGHAKADFGRET